MKRFSSLLDGVHYMIGCPLCSKTMSYDFAGVTLAAKVSRYGDIFHELIFDLNSRDYVKINMETEEVILEYNKSFIDYSYVTSGNSPASYISPPANYYPINDGVLFLRLSKSCEACCQYTYTLGIQADVQKCVVLHTFLNSEHLTLEEDLGSTVYEIRNVYTTGQTEYRTICRKDNSQGTNKPLSLPLVPMDLTDPKATLARVKKLVVFS